MFVAIFFSFGATCFIVVVFSLLLNTKRMIPFLFYVQIIIQFHFGFDDDSVFVLEFISISKNLYFENTSAEIKHSYKMHIT